MEMQSDLMVIKSQNKFNKDLNFESFLSLWSLVESLIGDVWAQSLFTYWLTTKLCAQKLKNMDKNINKIRATTENLIRVNSHHTVGEKDLTDLALVCSKQRNKIKQRTLANVFMMEIKNPELLQYSN